MRDNQHQHRHHQEAQEEQQLMQVLSQQQVQMLVQLELASGDEAVDRMLSSNIATTFNFETSLAFGYSHRPHITTITRHSAAQSHITPYHYSSCKYFLITLCHNLHACSNDLLLDSYRCICHLQG